MAQCYLGMELTATSPVFQAAQQDNNLKTADAIVLVTIEDENDNPPEFSKSSYSVSIPENLPDGTQVLEVAASDKDEVK